MSAASLLVPDAPAHSRAYGTAPACDYSWLLIFMVASARINIDRHPNAPCTQGKLMAEAVSTTGHDALLFPKEDPGERELSKWLEVARVRLLSGDAGFLYRGQTPPSVSGEIAQSLIPEADAGVDTDAGYAASLQRIKSTNAKIKYNNLRVTAKVKAAELHIQTQLLWSINELFW